MEDSPSIVRISTSFWNDRPGSSPVRAARSKSSISRRSFPLEDLYLRDPVLDFSHPSTYHYALG